jgi:hypothetical protein
LQHHKTGKQSPSSNGSHEQGHGKAPQLQTANEQPKMQKIMEPVSSQRIWAIGKWHWQVHQKPHQQYQVHLPTQGTGRPQERVHTRAVCMLGQTQMAEPNQMQFMVRGSRINYPSKVATPTAEMLVAKMLFNSVISMKGAQFMTMDMPNFYLMTPLHRAKFIQIKLSDIPNEVIREYKLREKATKNGSIYIRAKRGMYGLLQAGLLANELFEKRLNKHGYQQSKLVPRLWKHDTRPIQFTLVVDGFGVKIVGKEHAQHLKNTLKEHYKLKCIWKGK